jgi:hypothetical protein
VVVKDFYCEIYKILMGFYYEIGISNVSVSVNANANENVNVFF